MEETKEKLKKRSLVFIFFSFVFFVQVIPFIGIAKYTTKAAGGSKKKRIKEKWFQIKGNGKHITLYKFLRHIFPSVYFFLYFSLFKFFYIFFFTVRERDCLKCGIVFPFSLVLLFCTSHRSNKRQTTAIAAGSIVRARYSRLPSPLYVRHLSIVSPSLQSRKCLHLYGELLVTMKVDVE